MEKRTALFPLFVISLLIILVIILVGSIGALTFVKNGISWGVFSTSQILFSLPYRLPAGRQGRQVLSHFSSDSSTISSLQKENTNLALQLARLQIVEADNKALRDQFQAQDSISQRLLIATVVGRPNVIPNISFPENYVINVGAKENVKVGMAVVSNNMVVGTISQVTDYYSQVSLVSSKDASFAGKDSKDGAIGVVKGQGNGGIVFQNVLLSQDLKEGDMVVTSGSEDLQGIGYPPSIVVGKITGVEKSPSALYQSARVSTLLPLDTLSTVFVMTGK